MEVLLVQLRRLFLSHGENTVECNRWLETFQNDPGCCEVCVNVLNDLKPSDYFNGVRVDDSLCGIAMVFAGQTIHRNIKGKLFFKSFSSEDSIKLLNFLFASLSRFAQSHDTPTGHKIRTQLCLCICSLAIKGASFHWHPDTVLLKYFEEIKSDLIQLELLTCTAEELANDQLSMRQEMRLQFYNAMGSQSHQLLQYFCSLLHTESPVLFEKLFKCFAAWIEIGVMSPTAMVQCGVLDQVMHVLRAYCTSIETISDVKCFVISEACQVIRKLCAYTKQHPEVVHVLKHCLPCRSLNERIVLREILDARINHVSECLLAMLEVSDPSVLLQLQQLYSNISTAVVAMGKASLNVLEESLVAGPVLPIPSHVFVAVMNCTAITKDYSVSSASFSFWYACDTMLRLALQDSKHQVDVDIQDIASHSEKALVLLTKDTTQFPSEEVFRHRFDEGDRESFILYRREYRDLLRCLLQPMQSDCSIDMFMFHVCQLVEGVSDEWRPLEALLHGVSAVGKLACGFSSNQTDFLGPILNKTLAFLGNCSRKNIPVHRALLRTIAIVVGALGTCDGHVQKYSNIFRELVYLSLLVNEEDECFPFRNGEDHCATVALMKICLNEGISTSIAYAEYREGSDKFYERLLGYFKEECLHLLDPRVMSASSYVSITQQVVSRPLLSYRSLDLLFRSICIIASKLDDAVNQGIDPILSPFVFWLEHGLIDPSDVGLVRLYHGVHFLEIAFEIFSQKRFVWERNAQTALVSVTLRIVPSVTRLLTMTQLHECHLSMHDRPISEQIIKVATNLLKSMACVSEPSFLSVTDSLVGLLLSCDDVSLLKHKLLSLMSTMILELPDQECSTINKLVSAMRREAVIINTRYYSNKDILHVHHPKLTSAYFSLCRTAVETLGFRSPTAVPFIMDDFTIAAFSATVVDALQVAAVVHGLGQTCLPNLDQSMVLEVLKFERAFVLGTNNDAVDVLSRLPNITDTFLVQRQLIINKMGPVFIAAAMRGFAGGLPSWTLDKVSLTLRGLCGQFPHEYIGWMKQAISEFAVPRPDVKDTVVLRFIEQISKQETVSNMPEFKRLLKSFSGGKRKGDTIKKPPTK